MSGTVAHAPGRVNLIGDHTDYTGGLVLPVAIDQGITVTLDRGGDRVILTSDRFPGAADVPLDVGDPSSVKPGWARYVAGVVAACRPAEGGRGAVASTLPPGSGLSSSAALEVALALALGFEGDPLTLAKTCQKAEENAAGVPCGLMDQLCSVAGRRGHALLIDCRAESVEAVPLDPGCSVLVVPSGETRQLSGSPYAERRRQCEEAERQIGPLRDASVEDLTQIGDPTLRRRARHVVTENARVRAFAVAMRAGDPVVAGHLMLESHASLRDDFEVSTEVLDELVRSLAARRGVYGARLTGAGFGGCVVALTEPDAVDAGWTIEASDGARLIAG
jgi:galactokinase